MTKIPTQNRYPDRAGYTVLNTDTNQLEVFSDGKFGPVGAVPFDHDIDIYVGPGGDFETPDEALDYIQYLVPKHFHFQKLDSTEPRGQYLTQQPQINLIFKTNYVFKSPFVIHYRFMPWVNIMQEDINIPLIVTLENQIITNRQVSTIIIYNSYLNSLSLNLKNECTHINPIYVQGILLEYGSQIRIIPNIIADNFNVGLLIQGRSLIRDIEQFNFSNMIHYGIYSSSGSWIQIASNLPSYANNIRTTDSSLGAVLCANENGHIHVYRTSATIDNCDSLFYPTRNGTIFTHSKSFFNVSNTTYLIRIDNTGTIDITEPIKKGANVTNNIYPTDLIENTFDPRGWVRAPNGLTISA